MLPHEILFLRRLIKNQWLSPSELRDLQEDKLRRLITHAYDRVPYYRRLFDSAGLKPADIRGLADLVKIPTTSRAQLLELPLKDITARGIDVHTDEQQFASPRPDSRLAYAADMQPAGHAYDEDRPDP